MEPADKISRVAYIVVALNDLTGRIQGVGIFSDAWPIVGWPTAVMLEVVDVTYEAAHARAKKLLDEGPAWKWLRDLAIWTPVRTR